MPRRTSTKRAKKQEGASELQLAFEPRSPGSSKRDPQIHLLKTGIKCDTEPAGYSTPQGRSPLELVIDAPEGIIPLWAKGTTLRWRFRETSMTWFKNPSLAKVEIRKLLGESIMAWGAATPVKFSENKGVWDFEIVMRKSEDCEDDMCTLASSFFPDQGRHRLLLYPTLFDYPRKDQILTLMHELGHMFGLRHFFARVEEDKFNELFGRQRKFTIMNYGDLSKMTPSDKQDLKRLYTSAWNGTLTDINGTPIKFVKPFHTLALDT